MADEKNLIGRFSNDEKYIIKWFEGSAAAQVLDVTISEDTEPSI